MNFPNTPRTIILYSPFARRRNVEMSFIPSRGVESGFHALVPLAVPSPLAAADSCHRITSRFLCAIAAVITPPFSSLSRAFVRSSPYHSRPFVSSSLDEGRRRNLIWFPSPGRLAPRIIFAEGGRGGRERGGGTVDTVAEPFHA